MLTNHTEIPSFSSRALYFTGTDTGPGTGTRTDITGTGTGTGTDTGTDLSDTDTDALYLYLFSYLNRGKRQAVSGLFRGSSFSLLLDPRILKETKHATSRF